MGEKTWQGTVHVPGKMGMEFDPSRKEPGPPIRSAPARRFHPNHNRGKKVVFPAVQTGSGSHAGNGVDPVLLLTCLLNQQGIRVFAGQFRVQRSRHQIVVAVAGQTVYCRSRRSLLPIFRRVTGSADLR